MISHGVICKLPELCQKASSMHNQSVRVLGRCARCTCEDVATLPRPRFCRFSSSRASGSHCPNATARRRRASYAHRLEEYDATNALARMTHDGASLWVDVMAVPGADAPRLGSLYQIIGEMDSCAGNEEPGRRAEGPVLRARVVRCVDGLDVGIYYQALKERNAFLR